MIDPQERKRKNIALLQEQGVPTMEHLPHIEDAETVRRRTVEEVARRAVCCLLTVQVACDIAKGSSPEEVQQSCDFFRELIRRYGVEGDLTPQEQAVLQGQIDRENAVSFVWKYEALWTLLWALGLVEELDFPADICDCEHAIHAVSDCPSISQFLETCRLRDIEEILDEADRIFRYNWACVDARIHGREAPAGLNGDVVVERHWGLNWLIDADGDNDWDHVATNT